MYHHTPDSSHELTRDEVRCMEQITDAVLLEMHRSPGSLCSRGCSETSLGFPTSVVKKVAKTVINNPHAAYKVAHTALLLNPETRWAVKGLDKAHQLVRENPNAVAHIKEIARGGRNLYNEHSSNP
jgi:beta-galactosidase GanA